MIHHICLFQTKSDVSPEQLEALMIETRIRLLKIPEVSNLRVGKRIDAKQNPHHFFYSFECETLDKLRIIHNNAVFHQYEQKVLIPQTTARTTYDYEMEPGKDIRYS
jgi:hypothetical protein